MELKNNVEIEGFILGRYKYSDTASQIRLEYKVDDPDNPREPLQHLLVDVFFNTHEFSQKQVEYGMFVRVKGYLDWISEVSIVATSIDAIFP
jgi:hypothetical protein